MSITRRISKILDYFQRPVKTSQCAKERLQIIIAHERGALHQPDYLVTMQKELLAVIAKYVPIDMEAVKFDIERKEGFYVLELNATLPDVSS